MFTPPRFVVIDDKPEHLDAILDVFQELGAPCQGVTYDPEHGLDNRHLAGVRVLFVDLHLIDLAATTDETRHLAIIAGILEDGIRPTGGPFILVVWTEHDDLVTRLTTYLDDSLDRDKSYARPLAVVGLAKRRFIDLDTGKAQEGRAAGLRDAVEQAVNSQPQLTALVAWESDVQAATGATLSALVDLVPDDAKNSTSFARGLDEVLTRLAREAVPSAWGAVVEFPTAWWPDDEFLERFGTTPRQLLGGEYKIDRDARDRCRPRLVRVGAACDHAQNRAGPLLYLFGLEIPHDVQRRLDNTGAVRAPASEWSSPTLLLDTEDGPFVLAVNTRYTISATSATAEGWQPVYRLREQLLMHLISHASGHMARPGIVQL